MLLVSQISPSIKLLTKLRRYGGTVKPYYYSFSPSPSKSDKNYIYKWNFSQIFYQKDIVEYCNKVIENIPQNADGKQVCCMDSNE